MIENNQLHRWDRHFLELASIVGTMSKDPSTRVGAVLTNGERQIVGTGFNGFPRGILDQPHRLEDREVKLALTVHAETNALLAAARNGIRTKGCTLYVVAVRGGVVWGGPPCTSCTLAIIQAGIQTVVAHEPLGVPPEWSDNLVQSRQLLWEAGVTLREIPHD